MGPDVGIDSFAFHRWFGEVNSWEEPAPERWDLETFLERARAYELDVVSIQTIHLPDRKAATLARLSDELSQAGLRRILAWGHRSGLEDGTSPGKLADAMQAAHDARALGCDVLRVVCGDQSSWHPDPARRAERDEALRPALTAIAREAELAGVEVAVENHADATVADLAALVESCDSPRLGLCFDLGNSVRVGEDPIEAARLAAPLIVMSHLRDLRIQPESLGDPTAWWPCVTLGEGDLDIPAVLERLLGAPRCVAWLVETSNVLPGYSEPEVVADSLAYVSDWFAPPLEPGGEGA